LTTDNPNSSTDDRPSFETALGQLEAIVHDLEEGELGLEQALARYETGIKLLKQCYGLLEHAERRIEQLAGVDAAGNAVTEPFEDAPSTLEEKAASRGRRRSKTPTATPPVSPRPEPPPQFDVDEPGSLF
jgi:exodeoxyribonuclease VII small subunit